MWMRMRIYACACAHVAADVVRDLIAVEAQDVDVGLDALLGVHPTIVDLIVAVPVDVAVEAEQCRCWASEVWYDPLFRRPAALLPERPLVASVPIEIA